MTDKVTNIFLSGVGGQGTILASNIDVTTHFRCGRKVYSPLIKYGDVDFLLSFELLEALRYVNWVKESGKVIINRQAIFPPSVNLGMAKYPDDVEAIFKKHFKNNAYVIDGQKIAGELGNIQAANVVLIGALSNFFPEIKESVWIKAIKGLMKEKLHELNISAFNEGRKAL